MNVRISEETKKILARCYSPKNQYISFEKYSLSIWVDTLSLPALRVLGLMLKHLVNDNVIRLTQAQIAARLNISPQNAHKYIRELVAESVLFEGKPIVGKRCFIFNPDFGYIGDIEKRLRLAKILDAVSYKTGHPIDYDNIIGPRSTEPPLKEIELGDKSYNMKLFSAGRYYMADKYKHFEEELWVDTTTGEMLSKDIAIKRSMGLLDE